MSLQTLCRKSRFLAYVIALSLNVVTPQPYVIICIIGCQIRQLDRRQSQTLLNRDEKFMNILGIRRPTTNIVPSNRPIEQSRAASF